MAPEDCDADVPVVIVGGGPVGLALAGDLGWRGIACTLFERSDGAIGQPKMDMVGVRTMEFCRRWGIVDRVEESPYPLDYPQHNVYVTALTGYELGRHPVPSYADSPPLAQSPQNRIRCPQDMFDPILRRFADGFACVDLVHDAEVTGVADLGDRVRVTVKDTATGAARDVHAKYVVGCDGATSAIRDSALRTTMTGRGALTYTTNIIFRSHALPGLHDKGLAYRFIVIGPEGTWATLVAINGGDRWRMSIIGDERPRLFDEAEVAAAVRRVVGVDFDFEILSIVPWIRRELVADAYRAGRVFIAGDAAHVTSPTGGFGMNMGIGDAVDLSWKLAAVLEGWGGPALLDSYEPERRPVAIRNVAEASANLGRMLASRENPPGEVLAEDSARGRSSRAEFGPWFAGQMAREWTTIGIHLGYRYDGSPVIVPPDGVLPEPPVTEYLQPPCPGARAPHAWLADGRSTLDLFGRGFVLLRVGADAPDAASIVAEAAARQVPLAVVALDEPPVVEHYQGPGLVLVRPDGHIAWRSDTEPDDPGGLLDIVRGMAHPLPAETPQTGAAS